MQYGETQKVTNGPLEKPKELDIVRVMASLYNDVDALRQSMSYFRERLNPNLLSPEPKKESLGDVVIAPCTGLSSQINDINVMVNEARAVLADMIDRIQI